jgi:hypothetical protein
VRDVIGPWLSTLLLTHLEDLDCVANRHLLDVTYADTALKSFANFSGIVLKALQGIDREICNDYLAITK